MRAMVVLAPHLRRYWNPTLQPLYDRVAVTPLGGHYHSPTKLKLSDGRSELVVVRPIQPLLNPLKADTFASLLAPNSTALLPERPSFAALPTVKRKRNAGVKSKQKREENEFVAQVHDAVHRERLYIRVLVCMTRSMGFRVSISVLYSPITMRPFFLSSRPRLCRWQISQLAFVGTQTAGRSPSFGINKMG